MAIINIEPSVCVLFVYPALFLDRTASHNECHKSLVGKRPTDETKRCEREDAGVSDLPPTESNDRFSELCCPSDGLTR